MIGAFLIGLIALLVWLYPSGADTTALGLLRRSVWFFVLAPLAVFIPWGFLSLALGEQTWILWWIGILATVIFEECLKLWASRSENSGIRAIALVSLFGVWELMLVKPFLFLAATAQGWALGAELAMAIPAVFLHVLTAAIYGFHFRKRPELQFAICCAAHFGFNVAVSFAVDWQLIVIALMLPAGTVLLVPSKHSTKRGHWDELRLAP